MHACMHTCVQVRAIASGHTEAAHRYPNVTVLQADLSGFTPLSATKTPEELLEVTRPEPCTQTQDSSCQYICR